MSKTKKKPAIGRHSSGQARIVLSGKTYYLGQVDDPEKVDAKGRLLLEALTPAGRRAYDELVERWEANGRRPLDPPATPPQAMKVRAMFDAYMAYLDAAGRFHKNGQPTSQRRVCKRALDEFADYRDENTGTTYGNVLLSKVTAAMVRRHRDALERRDGLSRGGINRKVRYLQVVFRWARERALLDRDPFLDIMEIRPLSKAECGGREPRRKKRAVTFEDMEKTAAKAPDSVARMMRVQYLVGMRPGEVCAMRWCDVTTDTVDVDGTPCRIYTVAHAKNEHHEKEPTTYALPPAVVEILGTPSSPSAHVFPSPVTGADYDEHSYRNAVARACLRAGVEHFAPHELRHSFLTRATNRYGVLAAAAAANHADTRVTARYLHKDRTDGYRTVVGLVAS